MAEAAKKIGPELITVCFEFDKRVMRSFGSITAVKTLRDAGIIVNSRPVWFKPHKCNVPADLPPVEEFAPYRFISRNNGPHGLSP